MIHYRRGKKNYIVNNFWMNAILCKGSVFPRACAVSVPVSLATSGLVALVYRYDFWPYIREEDAVMSNNAIWAGFTFLMGFLVVFRTSNAYNRFWEGCTSAHKMGAEWFDSCAALIAFCRVSKAETETILKFQNTLVRLFSILHAVALGEIEDCGETHNFQDVEAFKMDLLDAESLDEESLQSIRDTELKVELVFQWIQTLIVDNVESHVLCIAPPLLTRSFQELAGGMNHFHDALRLSKVPFPFPYAVTCDCLLLMHYFIVPFIVTRWCVHPIWAFIFSFIQVFTLWSLNMIAVEMENPFGHDPNDLDGDHMHSQMNRSFQLLMHKPAQIVPQVLLTPEQTQRHLANRVASEAFSGKRSLLELWQEIDNRRQEASRATNSIESDVAELTGNWEPVQPATYESSAQLSSLGGAAPSCDTGPLGILSWCSGTVGRGPPAASPDRGAGGTGQNSEALGREAPPCKSASGQGGPPFQDGRGRQDPRGSRSKGEDAGAARGALYFDARTAP